jgi:phosphoglycolate phosphatase
MYKTILFDLDGTLTDPKMGITKSVQYALKKHNIEIENLDQLEKFIGPPLVNSFMDFYGFTETQSIEAVLYYREYFTNGGIFENEIYAGIPELLSSLRSENYNLAVATSKPTVYAKQIADYFHLTQYFDCIVGSHLDNTRTNKNEVIEHVISELNCDYKNTIMIGDRKHDIIGARQNDIDSIGVLYGYGSYEEIRRENPEFIAENVADLSKILLHIKLGTELETTG